MEDVADPLPLVAAAAALDRGDPAEAEALLLARLGDDPDDADVLVLLAAARRMAGRSGDAPPLLARALAVDPGHVEARLASIDVAIDERRFADGLAHLRQLPEPMRSSFDMIAREADFLNKLGEYESEIALYDRLITLRPDVVGVWAAKANTLRILGRNDEAVAVLQALLRQHPDFVQPWWLLSDLKDFRFDDEAIATMTRLLADQSSDADRIPLHFALGKAYEDKAMFGQAFDHYASGNRLRAASFGREMIGIVGKVDRTIAAFTPDFLRQRRGLGHPSDAPIFVVGLPRSGSTLVEQILASHPLIEGTSELPLLDQLMRDIAGDGRLPPGTGVERLAMLDGAQLRDYGQQYLHRAATYRRSDRPHFIDKMPSNWLQIGLIRLILPNARIIDARRHPLATGLSNFKQNFGSGGFFTFGQGTIAAFYRQYLRLVNHFERVDPGNIHRVVNERLVADFEPEVRSLLAFVGVPFDAACLDFHRNSRAVSTPSAAQVRRPINADGIDKWRRFEPWLGEMTQALGPALDGWDAAPGNYRDG